MKLYSEWQKPVCDGEQTEEGFISDLAFSKDNRRLITASSSGDVSMFDPHSHKLTSVIEGSCPVLKVCFVADKYFISGLANSNILLWDVRNTKKTVNVLKGHSKLIRSLEYHSESSKLISSSYDGNIRYWHIPSYQASERENSDNEETSQYRGILFKCPDVNQVAFDWYNQKLICLNSKGNMFVVDNLSIDHLKEDVKYKKFDDSLQLLLSWINPNASKRNSIRIISGEDYNPTPFSIISKIHHISTHPKQKVVLIRFSTSQRTLQGQQHKDWTCIYNLEQVTTVNEDPKVTSSFRAFGTDVIVENLLYAKEETRYSTMIEKKASFSPCGRVIASPEKHGVQLLSFSEKHDEPLDLPLYIKGSNILPSSDIFEQKFLSHTRNSLHPVANIPRNVDTVVCTKFSEVGLMLTVGEMKGILSFHQPRI